MRFMIVVPPLVGHINPTLSVGRRLRERGHDVAWCGYPDPLVNLLPDGADVLEVGESVPASIADAARDSLGMRGSMALKFLWEGFIVPIAQAMIPKVERAAEDFKPDVIISDQQALAGAIVARRRKTRWVTSATTSAELVDPFAGLPKVAQWIKGLLGGLQRQFGLRDQAEQAIDLRFSPELLIAFTTEVLVAGEDEHHFPPQWAFVGPALDGRHEHIDFPFGRLQPDCPRVLVSLGTLNADAGARFFRQILNALADLEVQGIVVAPDGVVEDIPPNVLRCDRVPQLALMPQLDAVVCHGGHNTVCEALAHGVPLAMAPIRDDQPIVADQVVRAGAGKRLRFGRVQADELARVISCLVREPQYRQAARRVQRSFAEAGGAQAAVDRLESLT